MATAKYKKGEINKCDEGLSCTSRHTQKQHLLNKWLIVFTFFFCLAPDSAKRLQQTCHLKNKTNVEHTRCSIDRNNARRERQRRVSILKKKTKNKMDETGVSIPVVYKDGVKRNKRTRKTKIRKHRQRSHRHQLF